MSTIQPEEVGYLAVTLPGLAVWLANQRQCLLTLRAAEALALTNGRLLWAKFSFWWLGSVGVAIQTLATYAAVASLLRRPSPDSGGGRVSIVAAFIAMSLLITAMGFAWRHVNRRLMVVSEIRDEKRDVERDAVRDTVRDIERDVERDVPRDVQRDVQRDVPRDAKRDSEQDALND